jgi:hypothetical protein
MVKSIIIRSGSTLEPGVQNGIAFGSELKSKIRILTLGFN